MLVQPSALVLDQHALDFFLCHVVHAAACCCVHGGIVEPIVFLHFHDDFIDEVFFHAAVAEVDLFFTVDIFYFHCLSAQQWFELHDGLRDVLGVYFFGVGASLGVDVVNNRAQLEVARIGLLVLDHEFAQLDGDLHLVVRAAEERIEDRFVGDERVHAALVADVEELCARDFVLLQHLLVVEHELLQRGLKFGHALL